MDQSFTTSTLRLIEAALDAAHIQLNRTVRTFADSPGDLMHQKKDSDFDRLCLCVATLQLSWEALSGEHFEWDRTSFSTRSDNNG